MSERVERVERFDDPEPSLTLVGGIVGVLVVFALVVAIQALYAYNVEQEFQRKVVAAAPEELSALRAEQLEKLTQYRWIDTKSGSVAIPIDRAMEIVVEEGKRAAAARLP